MVFIRSSLFGSFTSNKEFSKRLAECFIWTVWLYQAETRTLWKEDAKRLGCGEDWKILAEWNKCVTRKSWGREKYSKTEDELNWTLVRRYC